MKAELAEKKRARPPGAFGGRARPQGGRLTQVVLLAGCALVVLAGALGKRTIAKSSDDASAASSAIALDPRSNLATLPNGAVANPEPEAATKESGCGVVEHGFFDYVDAGVTGLTKVYVRPAAVSDSGAYELVLHVHGGGPVRKLIAKEGLPYVLATIDRGNGSSAYQDTFRNMEAWDEVIAGVDAKVASVIGHPAHATRVILTSWSAGYKAVDEALSVVNDRLELRGVVLLDSLHASYPTGKGKLETGQLKSFVHAAKRASLAKDDFFFDIAHTAIIPPGYASTTETATFVLDEVGIKADPVTSGGDDALPVLSIARKGRLDVRAYGGNDKDAHCDQLRLLPGILRRESAR